ncbi:ribosome assembly factor SBDS, partial [bacterium]|nr:ribosome assembly factor SBDS [bacterium]
MIVMVKMDDAVLARLKKNELNFEIYVDPFMAWDFKHGKDISIDNMVAYEAVYTDAKKGEEASKEDLSSIFGTTDFFKIAKEIIMHGDVQLTTVQKQQMVEKRENEIITFIKTNAHD